MRRLLLAMSLALLSCSDDASVGTAVDAADTGSTRDAGEIEQPPESAIYDFANGCFTVGTTSDGATRWLRAAGDTFAFDGRATPFFFKASDLGTYLLYDDGEAYLLAEDGPLLRSPALQSDLYRVDDTYVSGGEWQLELSTRASHRFQLRHRRSGRLLGQDGLADVSNGADLLLEPADGCAEHPEMALDAVGEVVPRTHPDGDLYGFVDTHSHLLSNFGFGGGGVFHGAPFHRLGVAVAMGDCEPFHGPEGRADFLGWGFVDNGGDDLDPEVLIELLDTGLLPEPNHATDGWPTFSDWPNSTSATHQAQYYRWLERAWMAGMRLVVQHAVSNEALCDLMADTGFQPVRWGCEDMVNIDRQLVEIRQMERYIDAQSGGPGEGWFRIVETPEEAREVIAEGRLAVILGIEVPNLFDCYLTRRPGGPECDTAHIEAELDRYYELGVRALFPVHKYDNAFTPGDGDRGIFELGSFLTTGHWSNFVEDCPAVPTVFDSGPVQFGGFNEPRDDYLSAPPNELLQLTEEPLQDILPYAGRFFEPALPGDWCQKAGLTEAGVALIEGMMARGMIIELDHLPRRSYLDVFELLAAADYPAAGTHGNINEGRLYTELGGISKSNFERCADPANPGSMAVQFRFRRGLIEAAGLYPAEGFGFDLNGLAGVPDPRFGPDAACSIPQENPVTYPFDSVAGDVTFTEPSLGERVVDFNTEGFIHIGMVPELIEDARRTGVTDEDLEFVFRSAEGYIRMWERALERAAP